LTEEEIRENAKKIVTEDLKTLQEKFAKAADDGSEELEERITEITDRLVQNQAKGVGEAHLVQFEETIASELKKLKTSILTIIKKSTDVDSSEQDIIAAVRKAGSAIKDKAQDVRAWRKNYDSETNYLVSQAASDTFEIIDHIRDLGLQDVGMRWAWTEGITHKDWAKYHAMKTKFDEWRNDVEEVVTAHPGLAKAREASEDIEDRAMAIAEDSVKELARLKETARWKLSAGDSSDDFSTKYMPASAAVAHQKVLDKVNEASEAVIGASQGTMESLGSVASSSLLDVASSASSVAASQAENIQSLALSISSSILGTPQGSVESVVSIAKSGASSIADMASSSIVGKASKGTAESIISVAQASASGIADMASSSTIDTTQGTAESVISVAHGPASCIAEKASSAIVGASQGTIESIVSVASDIASSIAGKASYSVVGTEPDVLENASSSIKSAASAVSEAVRDGELGGSAASISQAASSSLSVGSKEAAKCLSSASSTAISAASAASSQVSNSASSASSSLSSSASTASSKASNSASTATRDASESSSLTSSAASKKVWGGAMAQFVEAKQVVFDDVLDDDDSTYSEKIQSMASEAGDRFSDITKAVSEALLKPTSTQGSVESVTSLAAAQYSKALSAASVAYYGTQQGTGESIASIASSRYADAVAA
jgi:hypothetical protein